MIGIRIGTNYLKLPRNFSLQWELLHPAFSEQLLGGGYSFPIDFERCEDNDFALNFPHKFDYKNLTQYEYKVVIEKNGSFWKEGKLYIDRPGTKKVGGYLRVGIQSFSVLDKRLNEVDYGGDIILATTPAGVAAAAKAIVNTGSWQLPGFNFPMIYNPEFYGDNNLDFIGYINNYDVANDKFFENAANAPAPSNINTLVPMPYVKFILDKIFAEENLSVSWNPRIDPSAKFLYSNFALDQMSDPHYKVRASAYALFQTYSGGGSTKVVLNNDSTAPNYDPDNKFNTSTSEYEIAVIGAHRIHFSFPFRTGSSGYPHGGGLTGTGGSYVRCEIRIGSTVIYQSNKIQNLQANTNCVINGTVTPTIDSGDIGEKITLFVECSGVGAMNAITALSPYIVIDALEKSQINIFKNTMNIKNHVPDKTVREFLNDIKNEMQLSFFVIEGERIVYITTNVIMLGQASIDLTSKADPDHQAIPNTERIKLIGYEWPSDDALVNNNFKDYDRGAALGDFDGVSNFPTTGVIPGQTLRDINTNIRYMSMIPSGTADIVWKYHRDDYEDFIFDLSAETELRIKICPLFMYYDSVKDAYFPQISQTGSSDAFGLGITPPAPRFAYMVNTIIANGYPSSSTQPIQHSTPLVETGSRHYHDGTNPVEMLVDQYNWIDLRNGRFIWEKEISFTQSDLDALENLVDGLMYPKKIDNMEWIIKKITISENEQIQKSKLELLRRP